MEEVIKAAWQFVLFNLVVVVISGMSDYLSKWLECNKLNKIIIIWGILYLLKNHDLVKTLGMETQLSLK